MAARSSVGRRPKALGFIACAALAMISSAHSAQPAVDVAAADNNFGFSLLDSVQRTAPHGNVILSPVSAALALSMVLDASTDQTQHEMLSLLALKGSDLERINAANAQLISDSRAPLEGVTVSMADSLWVNRRRAQLRPAYVERMQTSYKARIEALDFSSSDALARINGWASQATNGRIPSVIDRLDPAELVILLNAVYFKGQWAHQFDRAQTRPRDFTLTDGSVKQVPRMIQAGHFGYLETPLMQAIRLPFGDGSLVMDVLLPSSASNLNALEAQLTPQNWPAWNAQYASRSGTIELPRFELKSKYRLDKPLQHLGMIRAFQPKGAQLTGMFEPAAADAHADQSFISSVLQSTYWRVDEEGAEAAAVTSIGVRTSAMSRPAPPFQMVVDRPFFCAIEDRRSGVLLFIAAIYDPAT